MRTDYYTKAVLTVIAICLIIIVFAEIDLFPKAYAIEPPKREMNYGLVPLNADGSISVTIKSAEEMDVNIVGIETSDKLRVNVEEVDAFAFSFCTVPVQVKK